MRGIVSSKFDITRLEKTAMESPDDLPAIHVGAVGGRYYPMGNLDMLEACRNASLHEIRVRITQYESKKDLIIDQMKDISTSDHIDPLQIREIIDELGRMGVDATDALKKINQDDTPIGRVATCDITDESLDMFKNFIDSSLSDRLPAVSLVIPTYILLRTARLDSLTQPEIARNIIERTVPGNALNFSWPTHLLVEHVIKNTPKVVVPEDPVFVKVTKPGEQKTKKDSDAENVSKSKASKKKPSKTSAGSDGPDPASPIVKDLHHVAKDHIVIMDDEDEPDMLVNKKTNVVTKLDDVGDYNVYKVHGTYGKQTYLIPADHDKHLVLDTRTLQGRTFDTVADLIKFAKGIKGDDVKLSLLWTTE